MTTLAAAVQELTAKLAQLDRGPCSLGDWVRLDAATTSAALVARHELCGACLDEVACDELDELLDELRYIKLCAQTRMLELSGYIPSGKH
ncbi:MAG TPA: hypothetical protein VIV58_39375 [Kofleriaceae bacterium]